MNMARYQIENTISGVVLGVYEGASKADALDAMARDCGYRDYADCCAVADGAGIVAVEV